MFAHFLHNFPTPIWSPNETNQGALFEQRLVAILLKKQIFLKTRKEPKWHCCFPCNPPSVPWSGGLRRMQRIMTRPGGLCQ